MKRLIWPLITTTVALGFLPTSEAATQSELKAQIAASLEKNLDVIKAARKEAQLFKTAAVTAEDVGDPDSFGRNVKYLGLAQTSLVAALDDCTPDPSAPPAPNDRCITLPAQPATTTINENDLGSMSLPAKATRSLMCFALTPLATFQFANNTGVPQSSARFSILATVIIANDALSDPSLIDPTTGLPFNGQLSLSLSTYSESRSLAVNERAQQSMRFSRHCIGGIVSKRSLVETYGLTDTQATAFFANPMKLSFGATGTIRLVDFVSYMYGMRLYGD